MNTNRYEHGIWKLWTTFILESKKKSLIFTTLTVIVQVHIFILSLVI